MDIGPLSVNPKVPFDRTARSPLRGRSLVDSSRGPKPLRFLSGTEVPSIRAIPLDLCRGRSHAANPEAAAQRSRSRSSAHTRRAIRSSEPRRSRWIGPPRLLRRDPKAPPLPACSPSRSTEYLSSDGSRRPARLRSAPKSTLVPFGLPVPRLSEDRLGSLLGPKTRSGSTGIRRRRRRWAGCPLPPTSEDSVGVGPSWRPCAARRLRRLTNWRSPLRGRSPVDSSPGPNPSIPLRDRSLFDSSPGLGSLRFEHLRSTRPRPKPHSNRTSG